MEALRRENHTLKRSLTDPRLFSGIGNAYSDEILFRSGLSPVALSQNLSQEDSAKLFEATRQTLEDWTDRLRTEAGDGFPPKGHGVPGRHGGHGRYRKPCLVCGTPVQRIVRSKNECNYCPRCQTGGKVLADRALSRLPAQGLAANRGELEERLPARSD